MVGAQRPLMQVSSCFDVETRSKQSRSVAFAAASAMPLGDFGKARLSFTV